MGTVWLVSTRPSFSKTLTQGAGQRLYQQNPTNFHWKVIIRVQKFTTVVFTVWLLYVWIKGSDFGSQQACNHLVKYVLLFNNIRATVTWLRVLFIMYSAIAAPALLFDFGVTVSAHMKQLRAYIYKKLRDIIVHTKSLPCIRSSTSLSQRQSEEENDEGTRVIRYVNLSLM
jgi:hypothetical protein